MPVLVAAARVVTGASRSNTAAAVSDSVDRPNDTARRLLALVPAVGVGALLLTTAMFGGGGVVHPSCATQSVIVFDGELDRVLATIRTVESGNDYTARAAGSTASGAYQFINSTWAGYGGYPEAWQAPPAIQDAKAAEWATTILQHHNGDIATVPVVWYLGHLPRPNSTAWDIIPAPDAGNVLTPRQYQAKWLAAYHNPGGGSSADDDDASACSGVVGAGNYRIPDGVTQLVASQISWGGYTNGEIPLDAMRYSPASGYMHPAASTAWDQLHAAALADGYDLRGNSYRPASAGGATAGQSNHGWGLAIDIAVLAVGTEPTAVAHAFASPEYHWLAANAPLYGFLNPAWAKPVSLGGTGTGGHIGDSCCYLEPWHWEWAAFMNVDGDAGDPSG